MAFGVEDTERTEGPENNLEKNVYHDVEQFRELTALPS